MVPTISNIGLLISFIPAFIVIALLLHWRTSGWSAAYATLRMLVQLLVIGYVLVYIFETDDYRIILLVLTIMLTLASWIAIRPLQHKTRREYLHALLAISIGSLPVLALVTQLVIDVQPWFSPRFVVPLAGMIFSNAMNAVSLAAERYQAETALDVPYVQARNTALDAALIPTINSLFAVGLVALPGMMTGQILSGVSPVIAAKYQIMVMTMLFGATGASAALYLVLKGGVASAMAKRFK